jgi:penicillin-binding protein 1A
MNEMTGGSLPAQTWHDIMAYAHNGIELKPLPGFPATPGPAVVTSGQVAELGAPQHPAQLSRRASDAIVSIEDLFRGADRQRLGATGPSGVFAEGGSNPGLGVGVRATGGRIETP